MKYLVTGGAGFIGSHIVEALLERGHDVRVLDNLSTGYLHNLNDRNVEFVEGDVTDVASVTEAVRGIDIVYHQAALASVPRSITDPIATHDACATGTLNVLHSCVKANVGRVIYAASSSGYGNKPFMSKREMDLPAPLSPYAVAKLAGEYYCHAFYETYGLETVCIRYFNVFGPRQDPDSPYSAVIPLFITALLEGRRPVVFGDGEQTRDFTFVKNVVHGNLLAAEADAALVAGKSFNVANGKSVSVNAMLERLNHSLGTSVEPNYEPPKVGDVRDSLADVSSARACLGYEPLVEFEDGLQQSIEYYKSIATTRAS